MGVMTAIATAETVAEAASARDNLPPLLFLGSGLGHERPARADLAVSRFVAESKARGASVAFDRDASDPTALEDAVASLAVDTYSLAGRRQICVLRRVDEIHASLIPKVKRLVSCHSRWWVISAGAADGPLRALHGFFLVVRNKAPVSVSVPVPVSVPVFYRVSSVAPAVASGASVVELVEAFRRFAVSKLPPREAAMAAAALDADLKENKRPVMLSTLVEDAIKDVYAQMPGS